MPRAATGVGEAVAAAAAKRETAKRGVPVWRGRVRVHDEWDRRFVGSMCQCEGGVWVWWGQRGYLWAPGVRSFGNGRREMPLEVFRGNKFSRGGLSYGSSIPLYTYTL